jgi:hypothetical protein
MDGKSYLFNLITYYLIIFGVALIFWASDMGLSYLEALGFVCIIATIALGHFVAEKFSKKDKNN